MAIVDTIEYSVCEDCLVFVDAGFNDATTAADDDHMEMRMRDELDGRAGSRHGLTLLIEGEDDGQ